MRVIFRRLLPLVGLGVLVFGFFCLNYTKMGTVERHMAFAAEHRLPPPSGPIFYGGVLALATGAGLVGYAIGARSSRQRAA